MESTFQNHRLRTNKWPKLPGGGGLNSFYRRKIFALDSTLKIMGVFLNVLVDEGREDPDTTKSGSSLAR